MKVTNVSLTQQVLLHFENCIILPRTLIGMVTFNHLLITLTSIHRTFGQKQCSIIVLNWPFLTQVFLKDIGLLSITGFSKLSSLSSFSSESVCGCVMKLSTQKLQVFYCVQSLSAKNLFQLIYKPDSKNDGTLTNCE